MPSAHAFSHIRTWLGLHGIRHSIPHKRNEYRCGPFDRAVYRERNHVERLINRLKQLRCVATRYEKRAANYVAMITCAANLLVVLMGTCALTPIGSRARVTLLRAA